MALIEHLEKLRHFHKLTQFSSINEAAMNTGLSQAGLSKNLILLEKELNCKLFKRSRDGLTLTREGSEVLEATKKIIQEAGDLENRVRSINASSIPRTIKIGMYDSIAVYFGIELQKYLKSVYPSVKMVLLADSSQTLLKKVIESEIDVAIGVNFPKNSKQNVIYFPLFDDHYSFYVASELADQVDELPVLLLAAATDANGVSLEKQLSKDLKNRTINYFSNFETIKTLTQKGLGIGVMPTQVALPLMVTRELVNVQLNQQRQLFGKHHIGFLVRADLTSTFKDFIEDIIRLGSRKMR